MGALGTLLAGDERLAHLLHLGFIPVSVIGEAMLWGCRRADTGDRVGLSVGGLASCLGAKDAGSVGARAIAATPELRGAA